MPFPLSISEIPTHSCGEIPRVALIFVFLLSGLAVVLTEEGQAHDPPTRGGALSSAEHLDLHPTIIDEDAAIQGAIDTAQTAIQGAIPTESTSIQNEIGAQHASTQGDIATALAALQADDAKGQSTVDSLLPAMCPCVGDTTHDVVWDSTYTVTSCFQNTAGNIFTVAAFEDSAGNEIELKTTLTNEGLSSCKIHSVYPPAPSQNERSISDQQRLACNASIKMLAAEDGIKCPF